jgi:hypothetical protein
MAKRVGGSHTSGWCLCRAATGAAAVGLLLLRLLLRLLLPKVARLWGLRRHARLGVPPRLLPGLHALARRRALVAPGRLHGVPTQGAARGAG